MIPKHPKNITDSRSVKSETGQPRTTPEHVYARSDPSVLQEMNVSIGNSVICLKSIEELLERDRLREKDGFPRKIKVGRLIRPGRSGKNKVTVVPTTVEEKLIHDHLGAISQEQTTGGSGGGEEGEIIGEQPVHDPQGGPGAGGAGQGEGGSHELESDAYEIGRILTEKFQLPNLRDKGKKRALHHYTYDLTDRNRGSGQLLDKKATLRRILETNISLGRVGDVARIDTQRFLVAPRDKVFRVLSREVDYESQALVFFVRDYSGSMWGKATETVVAQHILIYSWLLFQYARRVETRFILHDTGAKEVDDFYTYYNLQAAGGTRVVSAFRHVNAAIETEHLYRDYNIYVFYGTDGDDWDATGAETVPEIRKTLDYANRIGITVADNRYAGKSRMEGYLEKSGLMEERDLLRMDRMPEDADESRLLEGIRRMTSQNGN